MWNRNAGRVAAGAAAAAGLLHAAPARADLDSYSHEVDVGIFVGLSVYPKVQFNYGVDLRINAAPSFFLRAEGYGLKRWFVTAGALVKPYGVPFIGDAGISLGFGEHTLTPAALSLGPAAGWLFAGLQFNGLSSIERRLEAPGAQPPARSCDRA